MKSADTGSNTEKANRDTVFVDITGGFGVDFSFIARLFGRSVYIERQQHLCDIAEENFQRLGIDTAEVVCGDCEEWLRCNTGMHADLIMADPARRDAHGGRTFAISDCTPEVTALKELLLDKADYIMIKLSPMLDWHKAAEDFGPEVREIHIISTGNECKELLIVASRYGEKTDEDKYVNKSRPRLFCVNDSTVVEVTAAGCGTDMSESDVKTPVKPVKDLVFSTPLYLYEPNASIMKAGCFDIIEQRYHVRQIDKSSHLFVSDSPVNNFPGRKFSVTGITTMNKKELRKNAWRNRQGQHHHPQLSIDRSRIETQAQDEGRRRQVYICHYNARQEPRSSDMHQKRLALYLHTQGGMVAHNPFSYKTEPALQ